MNEEALKASLTVPWKIGTCDVGEKCWCRTIELVTPIPFGDEEITHVARAGEIFKKHAEHIVKLHNDYLARQ